MSRYIAVAQSILGNYNPQLPVQNRTKLPHEYTTTIMYQSRHNTTSTKSRTMLAHEYTTTIRYQPVPLQCNYIH